MIKFIKEWAGCLVPLVLFIGFIAFLFYFNGKGDSDKEKPAIGKYVYMDTNETIHIRRHCPAIGKQPGELGGAERAVTRIPVEEVSISMLDYSCSRCVSDELYEQLEKIIRGEKEN